MAKTALTQSEKDMVDTCSQIDALNVIGQDDIDLTLRLAVRVRDALNDLPPTPTNTKALYNKMAKNLRWIADYFEAKANAIP